MKPARQPTKARQGQIVAAMVSLAARRSPAEISVNDLAAAVGLSSGAIFRHFENKEAIGVAVIRWVMSELLPNLERVAEEAGAPMAALEAIFHAHVDFVTRYPGVPRIIFYELQQPADSPLKQAVGQLMGRYRTLIARQLEAAGTEGVLRDTLDRTAAVALFVGAVQGLVMQAMALGNVGSMKLLAAGVFDVWRQGVVAGGR
ncbi:MAG: TetR/AcrR family transcriptional regulator [Pseudomonadota bacterium]